MPLCLANQLKIWQCPNHNMPELPPEQVHTSLVCRHDLRSLEFGMISRYLCVRACNTLKVSDCYCNGSGAKQCLLAAAVMASKHVLPQSLFWQHTSVYTGVAECLVHVKAGSTTAVVSTALALSANTLFDANLCLMSIDADA